MSLSQHGSRHLTVPLHGRMVEVPRATLAEELLQRGPVTSLALIEAIVREAPREVAVARLVRALAPGPAPMQGTATLVTILGLVRLSAREAVDALRSANLSPPLHASAHAAIHLLGGTLSSLAEQVATDDLIAQRTPLVLAAATEVDPHVPRLVAALLQSLQRLQPALGISAYRALLGDVAEAVFRALQRGATIEALLGEGGPPLIDRLCAELPGTPDLVAARGMAWLLGAIAAEDDAARSAIERARDRFRDPAFHHDCAVMLGEDPARHWPPAA